MKKNIRTDRLVIREYIISILIFSVIWPHNENRKCKRFTSFILPALAKRTRFTLLLEAGL